MAIIWSIKHVCSKNFIIIQLLKESDFCSTFALFYQNQFVLKFYHKKGKGFQKWSIFWQLFEKKKEIIGPENESCKVLSFQKRCGDHIEEDEIE